MRTTQFLSSGRLQKLCHLRLANYSVNRYPLTKMNGGLRTTVLRALSWNGIGYVVATILTILAQPLFLARFGLSQYGIWSVVTTLIGYLGLSNFGLPAVTTVLLSRLTNIQTQRAVVVRSFLLLSLISFALIVILGTVALTLPNWQVVFGRLSVENARVARRTLMIAVMLFLLRFPLQLGKAALAGLQDVPRAKIYESLNVPAYFLSLMFCLWQRWPMVTLAIVSGIAYGLIDLVSVFDLRVTHRTVFEVRPSIGPGESTSSFEERETSYASISKGALRFFLLGIPVMLIWNSDNLIVSNVIGVTHVAQYSFSLRLLLLPSQLFNVVLGVLFPIYGRAVANGDFEWVRRMYSRLTSLFPLLAGSYWWLCVLWGKVLIETWSRRTDVYPGLPTIAILGGILYSLSVVNVHSNLLSALNKTKSPVRLAWIEGLVHVSLGILLTRAIGLPGMALAYLCSSVLVPFVFLPKAVRKETKEQICFDWRRFAITFGIKTLPFVVVATLIVVLMPPTSIGPKALSSVCLVALQLFLFRTDIRVALSSVSPRKE